MDLANLPSILYTKKDLVIVGSLSLYLQGYKSSFRDIDIVCTTISDIPGAVPYRAATGYTTTNMKAYSKFYEKELDIFIEPTLPEYKVIKGLKVQTLEDTYEYFKRIYPNVYNKEELLNNISFIASILNYKN